MIQPDAVLERYLELRERLESAPSQALQTERGLLFANACRQCRKTDTRTEHRSEKSPAVSWRCSHCSAVWPVEVGFLLRNEFRGGRRPEYDRGVVEMAALGAMLGRLSLQEKRVYLVLNLYEDVGSYGDVAVEAARRWPRMKPEQHGNTARRPEWSEWTVRRTCDSARRKLGDWTAEHRQRERISSRG